MRDKKAIEERNAKLINTILDYAIDNGMSLEEIDNCMEKVSEVYYSDGLIRRS
ncbi:hypothetical protein [Dethiothermospora halolimnae]|uniref:hypothetical protein n=1 Tax=Dethiothermospora halolimnae TaxID=3114390 RepID=UPI003CCBFD76